MFSPWLPTRPSPSKNAQLLDRVRRVAVLEERERIGMDLHDGIIQSIYAVGLSLELGRMIAEENPEEAKEHITTAIKGLDSIIRDIRSYIMDLQPGRIHDEPLAVALGRLVREFPGQHLGAGSTWDIPVDIDAGIADNCRLALFHITQEAPGERGQARPRLGRVRRTRPVTRPGCAQCPTTMGGDLIRKRSGESRGHGLSNMAVRCRSLGGELTGNQRAGQGGPACARWSLPNPRLNQRRAWLRFPRAKPLFFTRPLFPYRLTAGFPPHKRPLRPGWRTLSLLRMLLT